MRLEADHSKLVEKQRWSLEIVLLNSGSEEWPESTRLELCAEETRSDIRISQSVKVGRVLTGVLVKLQISIDASNSEVCEHVISYDLCCNSIESLQGENLKYTRIGKSISLRFCIPRVPVDEEIQSLVF